MIDKWVSEGSGWVIDRMGSHYINVTTYTPLHGSSYIELPTELKNPKKGLINIRNKDDECFRWCHIRHLNPQEKNPQRIKKEDKQSMMTNIVKTFAFTEVKRCLQIYGKDA